MYLAEQILLQIGCRLQKYVLAGTVLFFYECTFFHLTIKLIIKSTILMNYWSRYSACGQLRNEIEALNFVWLESSGIAPGAEGVYSFACFKKAGKSVGNDCGELSLLAMPTVKQNQRRKPGVDISTLLL
jgi:hypothetical protein